jgi:hypothetical protein
MVRVAVTIAAPCFAEIVAVVDEVTFTVLTVKVADVFPAAITNV